MDKYSSRRHLIANALVVKLLEINGTGGFTTNLGDKVYARLMFWDQVKEHPAVFVTPGRESRVYQGGGYKERFLALTIRAYVKEEDAQKALSVLLEEIETVIENNSRLAYQDALGEQTTIDIKVISIDTDEGVLEPFGVGEMLLEVQY